MANKTKKTFTITTDMIVLRSLFTENRFRNQCKQVLPYKLVTINFHDRFYNVIWMPIHPW